MKSEAGFGPRKKCNKKHNFLQALPISEEARVIVEDLKDGDDNGLKKWLNDVEELWPEVFKEASSYG